MAEIIKEYTDEAGADALKALYPAKVLVEIRDHVDGKFLVFADQPRPLSEGEEYRKLSIAALTPDKVDAYIDSTVTDLASAKEVLKLLAKGLIRVARNTGM